MENRQSKRFGGSSELISLEHGWLLIPGILKTYEIISKRYYYPYLKGRIVNYINTCLICTQSKYERNPIKFRPTRYRKYTMYDRYMVYK